MSFAPRYSGGLKSDCQLSPALPKSRVSGLWQLGCSEKAADDQLSLLQSRVSNSLQLRIWHT